MEHEYYMREALKEAQKAPEHDDVPVGAVIVREKKIIARAHNQIELLKDPTAHAEMIAITQAAASLKNERLQETVMYTTLEPCPMCAGALVLARVDIIFYAAADPKAGACGSVLDIVNDPRLNHQVKVIHGLLAAESQELLQRFFRLLRQKKGVL
jgi:tRNA(adenine34) deaminase